LEARAEVELKSEQVRKKEAEARLEQVMAARVRRATAVPSSDSEMTELGSGIAVAAEDNDCVVFETPEAKSKAPKTLFRGGRREVGENGENWTTHEEELQLGLLSPTQVSKLGGGSPAELIRAELGKGQGLRYVTAATEITSVAKTLSARKSYLKGCKERDVEKMKENLRVRMEVAGEMRMRMRKRVAAEAIKGVMRGWAQRVKNMEPHSKKLLLEQGRLLNIQSNVADSVAKRATELEEKKMLDASGEERKEGIAVQERRAEVAEAEYTALKGGPAKSPMQPEKWENDSLAAIHKQKEDTVKQRSALEERLSALQAQLAAQTPEVEDLMRDYEAPSSRSPPNRAEASGRSPPNRAAASPPGVPLPIFGRNRVSSDRSKLEEELASARGKASRAVKDGDRSTATEAVGVINGIYRALAALDIAELDGVNEMVSDMVSEEKSDDLRSSKGRDELMAALRGQNDEQNPSPAAEQRSPIKRRGSPARGKLRRKSTGSSPSKAQKEAVSQGVLRPNRASTHRRLEDRRTQWDANTLHGLVISRQATKTAKKMALLKA